MTSSFGRTRTIVWTLAAALVLIAAGWRVGVRREALSVLSDFASPEACLAQMLAAEQSGDLAAYLECFSNAARDELRAGWTDASRVRIVHELQSSSAGLAGRAVTQLEFDPPDHAALVLERIYKDHAARQKFRFTRREGRWQIDAPPVSDWKAPAIPYGTPVTSGR